jgi:hypothetical protein
MTGALSSRSELTAFVRRCCLFAVLFVGVVLTSVLGKRALAQLAGAELPPQTRTLILGDSHGRVALDPSVIPRAANVAQDGEPYLASYAKLVHLLAHNPQVKSVVISYSPHNLTVFNDRKFSDVEHAFAMGTRYCAILPASTLKMAKLSLVFGTGCVIGGADITRALGQGRAAYLGDFEGLSSRTVDVAWLRSRMEAHFAAPGQSALATHALGQMVRLTGDKGIRFFLVATPLHPAYAAAIPAETRARYREMVRILRDEEHMRFVDLSGLITDPALFFDYDHVTAVGARIVSESLTRSLASR